MEPNYGLLIVKILTEVIGFTVVTYLLSKSDMGYKYFKYASMNAADLLTLKLSTKKPVMIGWALQEIITTESIRASIAVIGIVSLILVSASTGMFVIGVVVFAVVGGFISWAAVRFAGNMLRETVLLFLIMVNFAIVWSWFIPLHGISLSDLDVSVVWLILIAIMVVAIELIVINFVRALLWRTVLDVFFKKKKAYNYPNNSYTKYRRV